MRLHSYAVVVKSVYNDTMEPVNGALNNQPITWRGLSNLNRMTAQVAKETVMAYVLWPRDLTQVELRNPDCIARFKVRRS